MRQRTTRLTVISLALALIATPVITIAASSPGAATPTAVAQPELYATITQTPLNGGVATQTTMPLTALNALHTGYKRDEYTIKKDKHASEELNRLSNEARKNVGLKPFKIDPVLTKEAQRQAAAIAKKDSYDALDMNYPERITPGFTYFSHNANQSPGSLAEYWVVGSIIWKGFMDTPWQRENILSHGFTRVGSAVHTGAGTAWGVQIFASYPQDPKPGKIKPKIAGEIKGFTDKKVKPGTTAKWKVYVTDFAQVQRHNGKKWVTVQNLSEGKNTLKIKAPKKAGVKQKYRIVMKETYYSKKATSKTITLTTTKKNPTVTKKKSTITGFSTSKTVKPNKKVTWKKVKVSNTAVLQRYDKKQWKTVRTLKKGTHNITLKAGKKNKAVKSYRIVVKETATTHSKTSPTVRLTTK